MKEIWKDIKGFEGLYQVSNKGNVKSFRKSSKFGCPSEFILKNSVADNGYAQVVLYSGSSRKKCLVHRLVAEHFIDNPNPDEFTQVNHKDENRLNNDANNLEWCTAKYNNRYGTSTLRASIKTGRMVEQYLPSGEFLACYASIKTASLITGIKAHSIKDSCLGYAKSGAGFVWKYSTSSSSSFTNRSSSKRRRSVSLS